MKSKIADKARPKVDALSKRYGRIGMRVVAAAAPYQPKAEDHPSSRAERKRVDEGKSKKGTAANHSASATDR